MGEIWTIIFKNLTKNYINPIYSSQSLVAMSGQSGNRVVLGGKLVPGVYIVSADVAGGQTHVQKVTVR